MIPDRLRTAAGAPWPIAGLTLALLVAHGVRVASGASGTLLSFDAGRLLGAWETALAGAASIITHVFVHGDLMHLALNAAALYLAGREVAAHGRPAGAVILFFAAAAAGAAAHAMLYGPGVALFGASAGVAGLMATWLRLAVHNVRVFVALALFWLILNYSGVEGGGVTVTAWEAHVGGFLFGLVLGPATVRLFSIQTKNP